jgi:sialidase-1
MALLIHLFFLQIPMNASARKIVAGFRWRALLLLATAPVFAGNVGWAVGEYDPSTVAGCILWLDGTDAESIEVDQEGRVLRWRDKSQRGHHFEQETASARPRPAEAGEGGPKGIHFSGAEWLRGSATLSHPNGESGVSKTIMVVFETAEEHPLRQMGLIGNGGHQPNQGGLMLGFNDRHIITQNNAAMLGLSDGEKHLLNLGGDGNTARSLGLNRILAVQYPNLLSVTVDTRADPPAAVYVYGELKSQAVPRPPADTTTAVPEAPAGWAVGAASGHGALPFQGLISEVLVFDRVLPPPEREMLERWLQEKHALVPPSPWILDPRLHPTSLHPRPQAREPDGTLLMLRADTLHENKDGDEWVSRHQGQRDPANPDLALGGGLLAVTPEGTLIHIVRDRRSFVKLEYQDGAFLSDQARSVIYALRSVDGGKTWKDAQIIQDAYCGAMRDIIVTRRGNVVASLQAWDPIHERHVTTLHTSTDDGRSYHQSVVDNKIGRGLHDGLFESAITELSDGSLWLLGRTSRGVFWQSRSTDGGLTWSEPTPTDISAGGYPAALLQLASGRLVLAWNRFYPDGYEGRTDLVNMAGTSWYWGTQATSRFNRELSIMFSEDDGQSWTQPLVIVAGRQDFAALAYPHLMERQPGEIHLWAGTFSGRMFEADFFD